MTTSAFEQIEAILIQATTDMLEAHERPARGNRREELGHATEDIVVATIGFAADRGQGSITLVAPFRAVDALRPAGIRSSEIVICDVLGELCNMVVGRLKNQLLRRGVCLFVGLPTKGLARTMRLQRTDGGARSAWHRFDFDDVDGALYMRVDAKFEDLELSDEPMPTDDVIGSEGDMMFFDGGV